eukprot:15465586-Alexandrium_andersonii.AAC.1
MDILPRHDSALGRDPRLRLDNHPGNVVLSGARGGARVVSRGRGKQERVSPLPTRTSSGSPAHGLEGPPPECQRR